MEQKPFIQATIKLLPIKLNLSAVKTTQSFPLRQFKTQFHFTRIIYVTMIKPSKDIIIDGRARVMIMSLTVKHCAPELQNPGYLAGRSTFSYIHMACQVDEVLQLCRNDKLMHRNWFLL